MRTILITAALVAASAAAAESPLHEVVQELKLSNGMTWLLVERHQAPVFTGYVRVKVGGADEEPGSTGLAHLFEHMAFKGTPVFGTSDFAAEKRLLGRIAVAGDRLAHLERSGKGDSPEAKTLRAELQSASKEARQLTDENALATLYQLNGAVGLNATTDKDVTSYFVSLPRNRLELWATLEASRLASPVLRDFYAERDVVNEERRMRIDSNPGGAMYEELNQLAFTMSPYRWPTVGYREDLAAMTLETAHRFQRRFYVPSNAVGCLVGDITLAEARPLLERTFGSIPAAPPPAPPVFSEPPPRTFRRSIVTFDASPQLMLAFRKPAPPARDDFVFDVLEMLLGEGRTSRLHRRLVLKDRLAQGVGVFGGPGSRLDGLFIISATPMTGVSPAAVESAIWSELEQLRSERVGEEELAKVRRRVSADHARSIDSNAGLASVLSRSQVLYGTWRYAADHPQVIASITPEEVQAVARKYFVRERAVAVELQKPTKEVSR